MTIRAWSIAVTGALVVLATACDGAQDPEPSDSPDELAEIGHPAEPDELVLRVEIGGGFVPVESNLTSLPLVSLYGDGRVITQGPQIAIFPGPALPNLRQRTITESGMQTVLRESIEAGLEGPDRDFPMEGIADAATTTFTVAANGDTHSTSAYALGVEAGPFDLLADEQEARARLVELRDDLTDLQSLLPASEIGEERAYEIDRMRIFVQPGASQPGEPELEQSELEWPLSVGLAEFGEPYGQLDFRCGVVDGADLEELLPAAEMANELTPWVSDGESYRVLFRPLLPDESGCAMP